METCIFVFDYQLKTVDLQIVFSFQCLHENNGFLLSECNPSEYSKSELLNTNLPMIVNHENVSFKFGKK